MNPIECDELGGLIGLQNLGNTCYINAALQALSNCQPLTRYMLYCPDLVKDSGLSHCYRQLIDQLWNSKDSKYAVPSSIIQNIKCIYPAFRGFTQQDAQEFLRFFLQQLHDELKPKVRPASEKKEKEEDRGDSENQEEDQEVEEDEGKTTTTTKKKKKELKVDTDEDEALMEEKKEVKEKPQEPKSIISEIFEFRISSSIICSSCNDVSTTNETFMDLSVPIESRSSLQCETTPSDSDSDASSDDDKQVVSTSYLDAIPLARWFFQWISLLGTWFWGPQISLHDCLSVFFGTDPLDGDNQYSCELCTKKNRGVKYLKILELPEILCIHFKRYESVGSAKITSHVTFPLEGLDLAPFMSPNSPPQSTTYNLIACICHHGYSLQNGHYITYALNCCDQQWYEFDDQYVTCVSSYQVESSEAYILFYQRTPPEDDPGGLDVDP